MRKVYVELKVKLIIRQNQNIETSKVIEELDYNFADTTAQANIEDTEILGFEIKDSK